MLLHTLNFLGVSSVIGLIVVGAAVCIDLREAIKVTKQMFLRNIMLSQFSQNGFFHLMEKVKFIVSVNNMFSQNKFGVLGNNSIILFERLSLPKKFAFIWSISAGV